MDTSMTEEEYAFCKGISAYLCEVTNMAKYDADYFAVEVLTNKDWLKKYLNEH